jgi:hypothetical protein
LLAIHTRLDLGNEFLVEDVAFGGLLTASRQCEGGSDGKAKKEAAAAKRRRLCHTNHLPKRPRGTI